VARVAERAEQLGGWGIEPVPRAQRVLSAADLALLWGDLGVGLLVLVTGALLTPALGFGAALAAIVAGSLGGVALLALAGVAGADHGVPTMVLFRPVLGTRGSWIPSVLNSLQLVGWTAVELWAMSYAADLVARTVFGFSARPVWLGVAAVVCTAMALWGPVGVTRVWLKRFGAWVVLAICAAITIGLAADPGTRAALSQPGSGGWPTFGAALDLVIAMPISWLPLVADYNRFARTPRSAFAGTFGGYLAANVWLYALGAALVLGGKASPSPAGIAAGILALGGGSAVGLVFLAGLLVGETDEAFADIYSGAVSLQNIFPRAPQRALASGTALAATALAAWLTMQRYESFLLLIGSVFLPLFGMLAADLFVVRRRRLDIAALYRRDGPYWYLGGMRAGALVPWLAGFLVYHWISPLGPVWWVDLWARNVGAPPQASLPYLCASLPAFAVSFALALVFRPRAGRSPIEARG
jgi:nucleobase:cation symporter-1, NCS1 family